MPKTKAKDFRHSKHKKAKFLKTTVFDNPYIPVKPTEKQAKALVDTSRELLYGGAAGGGKGQKMDDLVVTPYGFRKMEDIEVGDRICSPTHGNTQVTKTIDLGKKQFYKVSFKDGTSLDVTEEHLWLYWRSGHRDKKGLRNRIGTTKYLYNYLKDGYYDIKTPLPNPIQFTKSYKKDMRKIDPYTLGILLGDGSITKNARISTGDKQVIERIRKHHNVNSIKKETSYLIVDNSAVKNELKRLGLFGLRSEEKFIPEPYKLGNIEQRWKLAKGLMDSDGTIDERGHCAFTSTSKELASDTAFLLRSLGFRVTESQPQKAFCDGERKLDKHRLYIQGENKEKLFHLERKKKRVKPFNGGNSTPGKTIKKIEKIGKDHAKCIKVDNPNGLYIAGKDMIVTHNSEYLLMAALQYVHLPPSIIADYSAIIFRRTFQDLDLEGALIPRSKEWLSATDAVWNGQKKKWKFPTGSTLSFGYLRREDDKYRYQSSEFQFIAFDELTQFQESQYTYLFSRLRRNRDSHVPLRIRSASNPGGRGHEWVKNRFITGKNRENRTFIPATIEDNPHIMEAEYKRGLNELDDEKIEQLLKGNWDVFAGAYFGDVWGDGNIIKPVKGWPAGCRVDRSYDYGDSSPSACIWWLECNGEEIELHGGNNITPPAGSLIALIEYYTWTGTPNQGTRELSTEQAKKIRDIEEGRGWNVEPGPADSSIFDVRDGKCIAEEMSNYDVNWEEADKSPGSRINGAQIIRKMLLAGKERRPDEPWLLFSENCNNCIRTIPTLPQDERNPEDVDTDAEDHAYDAVRYRVLFDPPAKGGGTFRPGGV